MRRVVRAVPGQGLVIGGLDTLRAEGRVGFGVRLGQELGMDRGERGHPLGALGVAARRSWPMPCRRSCRARLPASMAQRSRLYQPAMPLPPYPQYATPAACSSASLRARIASHGSPKWKLTCITFSRVGYSTRGHPVCPMATLGQPRCGRRWDRSPDRNPGGPGPGATPRQARGHGRTRRACGPQGTGRCTLTRYDFAPGER